MIQFYMKPDGIQLHADPKCPIILGDRRENTKYRSIRLGAVPEGTLICSCVNKAVGHPYRLTLYTLKREMGQES